MNKKIKVFYIADWFNIIQKNLLDNLDKNIDCTLILADKYPAHTQGKYLTKIFPTIDLLRFIYWKKTNEYFLIYKKSLFEYIRNEKPDIIICNLCYKWSTIQIARFCRKNNIKFILHTETQRWPKGFISRAYLKIMMIMNKNLLFEGAEFILPWTEGSYKFFKNLKFIENKEKIELVPAGIDTGVFFKNSTNKKRSKKLRLICVARFLEYKRHADLIEALDKLVNRNKINVSLDLIGTGELKEKIKKMVDEKKLGEHIKFLNSVPLDQMKKIYWEHDILILPSYNEAIGLVVPEAMACGIPAIVSDSAGARMYVDNEKDGYIFRTADIEDLLKKIILLSDTRRRAKMGKNAKDIILNKFSAKKCGEKFSEIIKKAMTKNENKYSTDRA